LIKTNALPLSQAAAPVRSFKSENIVLACVISAPQEFIVTLKLFRFCLLYILGHYWPTISLEGRHDHKAHPHAKYNCVQVKTAVTYQGRRVDS